MKILFLDTETAPNTAHVWGLWQQNVGLPQILEAGYVLCWAAKWAGSDEIMFDSIYHSTTKRMLKRIHALLDEADVVVHYNGSKFDIPTLNKEFLLYGFKPPAPYKQEDLLKTMRSKFKFPSNKLDYVAKALGLKGKLKHTGHELWINCMKKDPASWELMEKYNKQDVVILEQVYQQIKPWVKGHANHSVHSGHLVCPNCGSGSYQRRGYAVSAAGKYARYQCKDCGAWFRSNKTEAEKDKFIGL